MFGVVVGSNFKRFQHFIPVMIDYFDSDFAGLGFVEGPSGNALHFSDALDYFTVIGFGSKDRRVKPVLFS